MSDDRFQEVPVTRSRIASDLRALGTRAGAVVMVHCAMSKIGWVVGGAEALIHALRDVIGPEGTLVAYTSWEDNTYHLEKWPDLWRDAYLKERPPFDPDLSEARHDHGRVAERIRTWPGALRSTHPEANISALGPLASWLTEAHPDDFAFGERSPFAKIVEADGQILLMGAPMGTLTILHLAETLARVREKRLVKYRMPVRTTAGSEWRWYEDIDTSSRGVVPYEEKIGRADPFVSIGVHALQVGMGVSGKVGNADSYLFQAKGLVDVGIRWLEEMFGDQY